MFFSVDIHNVGKLVESKDRIKIKILLKIYWLCINKTWLKGCFISTTGGRCCPKKPAQ